MIKHIISDFDLNKEEIEKILDLAIKIKNNPKKFSKTLDKKTLAMIFQKTSTRTRVSFETAMTQLGGHAIFLDWNKTNFTLTDIKDETKVVSEYVDFIMARLLKHSDLEKMSEGSEVPVINGLCEKWHPCQILGDLLTIKEKKGELEGLNIVYMGIGNNVSNSLSLQCTKMGMNFVLCCPEKDPDALDEKLVKELSESQFYTEESNVKKALKDADIVYTDTWVNLEFFFDPKFAKEKKRRIKTFMPYQVNEKILKGTNILAMHCLPAHIGYEVDDYAVHGPNSIIFEQAENRLHAQKGLLLWLNRGR